VATAAHPADRLRIGVLTDLVLDEVEPEVATEYQAALSNLSAAGLALLDAPFPELAELPHLNRHGGLAAPEAWAWHRELLEARGDQYDQRVRTRIEPGGAASAEYYIEVILARRRLMAAAVERMRGLDAFVLPTVPILPPTIASFDDGDRHYYTDRNLLTLRNTSIGNFLDTCAISLPAAGPPVGLMLMGRPGGDADLLAVARTVEAALAASPR
jgi:aspartyl-tRNA(Asn)/glutamyl-tRNA(Gln) amidotransferase subunit A